MNGVYQALLFRCLLAFVIFPLQASEVPLCSGENRLLSLVDRPSEALSACIVPARSLLIESGYTYQQTTPNGFSQNLPQMEWRFGLGRHTEIDMLPPTYNWQSTPRQVGYSGVTVGAKRIAYHDDHQLVTLQAAISPPSGGKNFGSRKNGCMVNGIYNYSFDSGFGIAAQVGFASFVTQPVDGNQRYFSMNPLILAGWPLQDKINLYVEAYAQSRTAPNQGWGVNADTGLVFLVAKNLTVDVVYNQRLYGALNSLERSIGGGLVIGFF
ncbi:hypothetical protein GH742_03785 [Legionella sp. MW5194]|uniref:hypothetical protein n=1 Tax=Legionella sp. MW5194 TaxID=2662448 RepID=UPI00193E5FBA|nr:hypothetical protein [Legionella sp. MW5194]QRN03054.1 hypothetical protein GH742_03785 [Legionella sp. MW5194]